MLVGEMALEIRLLAKRGKGLRAIAREIGVSRNTVRRYLRDGDADRYRQRPQRSGKLATFDDYIACQWRRQNVPDGGLKVYQSG